MGTTGSGRTGTGALLTALTAGVVALLLIVGVPSARAAAYSSPAGGTRQVVGSILDRYLSLGGPRGFLGSPLTDELATPDGTGRYNHFQGGSVYWTSATGAQEVHGAIRNRWAAQGWERGALRYPTTGERTTPNGIGRYNHFQGGSVYWTAATGAHTVRGAIRDRWAALGWENSTLGFPTSQEHALSGGGRAQDFQHGRITRTAAGSVVVTGGALPLGVRPAGRQVVTVVAPSAGSTTATLTAWQKGANGWTAVVGPVPARVGSTGVGRASETSTRTPAGTFPMTEAFGRAADPGTALPYRVIDTRDWWVSDVSSPLYNEHARCTPGSCPFREPAGENLWSQGAVYDNAVVIDYNRSPVVAGAGSAFFLHIADGRPTAGCVAIDRAALRSVLRWLTPGAEPVIAIGVG